MGKTKLFIILITVFTTLLGGLVVLFLSFNLVSKTTQAQSAFPFTFGVAGDYANGSNFQATAGQVKAQNVNFQLAVGDLAYSTVEQSWCNYWKNTAFYNNILIVAGNHDSGESSSGNINTYAQYCPYTLSSPSVGTYAKQYYFDYPQTSPIARFIMISPGLGGSYIGFDTNYAVGHQGYTFTQNAIDDARAKGVKWVVVGMHKNCLSMGTKSCEIGTDLMNLLINKRVDLVLQGHDHNYQRGKQLTCAQTNSYNASCVADDGADGIYTKGAGTIFVVAGMGGQGLYSINTSDSEAGYFAKWMGSNINATYGFTKFTVTDSQIIAQFIRSAGSTFTDAFTITNSPPPSDTTPPSVPTNLTATGTAYNKVNLSWTASTDNVGVTGYKIFRNSGATPIGTSSTNSYSDTSVSAGNTYTYTVSAYDAAGNESAKSASAGATTPCAAPVTTKGVATTSVDLTDAGNYKIWSRIMAPDTTKNSYVLQIDGDCGTIVGDSAIAANSWTWVDYKDGVTSSKITQSLTSGTHTVKMIGRESNVKLDRVIFTTDLTCIPIGTGDNCTITNPPPDTTAPSVSISSPTAGTTVSGTVNVTANATDNVSVAKVEFYVDGSLKSTDTTSPYSYSWDTTTTTNGSHTLSAKAYDAAGNVGTSSNVSVTVNNAAPTDTTPPSVSITNLNNGAAIKDVINVTASATDNVGVTKVEFYVDSSLKATSTSAPYSFSWDTKTVTNGSHSVSAKAYDTVNNSTATVTVTVDNQAPSTPTNLTATAAAYNKVNLAWTASTDNVGVTGYWVVRNGTTIASSATNSYIDNTVSAFTAYSYNVIASDAVGNVSAPSNTATATTPAVPDTQAPTAPTNLSVTTVSTSQINLAWNASTDNIGVTGYEVYRNNTKIATVNTLSFGDATVSAGNTYSYFVKARDAASNVSAASNTVTVTVSPPPAGNVLTFTPIADASVKKDSASTNYGSAPTLVVDHDPFKNFLMKFSVSGISGRQIVSAKLRLYAMDPSDLGGTFHKMGNGWSEKTVTWNNALPNEITPFSRLGSVSAGNWYEIDAKPLITGDGTFSLKVHSTSNNGAGYYSREQGSGFVPKLIITVK